jgi:hypothetical protein
MNIKNLLKIILFSISISIAKANPQIQYSQTSLICENGATELQMVFKESFREYPTFPLKRFFLLIHACKQNASEESTSNHIKNVFNLTRGYYIFGEEDAKYGKDFNVYPIENTEKNSFDGTMEINEVKGHGNFVQIQNHSKTISVQGNFYYNSQVYFNINGKSYPASVINNIPAPR